MNGRRAIAGAGVWLVAAACAAPPGEEPAAAAPPRLDEVLREQAALYPLMEPQDLYKLVHQVTMGPSHLFMGDNSGLDTGLLREIDQMKPLPAGTEPEFETLDPDIDLVRVNLRPYLLRGGRAEDLALAVGRTAHVFHGDHAVLEAALEETATLVPDLALGFDDGAFRRHVDAMLKQGWPAGHHSAAYGRAYEPAYRIVERRFLR